MFRNDRVLDREPGLTHLGSLSVKRFSLNECYIHRHNLIAKRLLHHSYRAKLVARFGSIQRTFEILFRAWNAASGWDKKWQTVVAAGGGVAGEILGITSIKEACLDS